MAFCLAVMMFSLAGIPPMAGFFGKLFVFRAAIEADLYALSIIGVLASVVGAFYYLRIVKIMYIDAPSDDVNEPMPRELSILAGAMTAFTLLFFIYPSPLVELADMAGSVLMQGDAISGSALQGHAAGH
jgi:NADH-quinone oxidoreductase subunit N